MPEKKHDIALPLVALLIWLTFLVVVLPIAVMLNSLRNSISQRNSLRLLTILYFYLLFLLLSKFLKDMFLEIYHVQPIPSINTFQ